MLLLKEIYWWRMMGYRGDYCMAAFVQQVSRKRWSTGLSALLVTFLLISACASGAQRNPSSTASATGVPSGTGTAANTLIVAMLTNLKTYGWDNNPGINGGLGGLWINWRYGTNPLQVNLNGTGQPDDSTINPPRHDVLTDLRYLHNLLLYHQQNPHDTQFASETIKYTAIVKMEYSNSSNERGWIFDELLDISRLSQDSAFAQDAQNLAQNYFNAVTKSPAPIEYKTSATHPNGYYRVDLEVENGAALIQAGTLFHQPTWVTQGQQTVAFVFAHAYIPAYHTLTFEMDNVLNADGTINADETIYRDTYQHTRVDGSIVRVGATALEVLSLLHAYMVLHDAALLQHAQDLLSPLTSSNNLLGLWDAQNGGYYTSATFHGNDIQNPGQPKVPTTNKEAGRQLQMLEAFRVADSLTNNSYLTMQNAMAHVLLTKAYYAPGHGILYATTATWAPAPLKSGVAQDWVTTEAMGIALEALFSLNASTPW